MTQTFEDTRTFRSYRVLTRTEVLDGRTGELVGVGGTVELSEDPLIVTVLGRSGPELLELPGTNVYALVYAGLVEAVADAPAAKAAKGS